MAGLAQKGGAVISHVQIAPGPDDLHATRIATGEARLVIGGDAIVSASAEVLSKIRHGLTAAVVNSANTPTAEFIRTRSGSSPVPVRSRTCAPASAMPAHSSTPAHGR